MGLFVVFEGIDGSGSSTQASQLYQSLAARGIAATLTTEPTTGPIGHLIREIIGKRIVISSDPHTIDLELAYLFAADRFDHLHNAVDGIQRKLADGHVVISTRYHLSSFVYHVHGDADRALVHDLNAQFPVPNLTFYLDCPLEEALRRIVGSGRSPDRNENETTLTRVQRNYEHELSTYAGRVVRIDARLSIEQQHERALAAVLDVLGPR